LDGIKLSPETFNLSSEQFEAIKDFLKKKPFMVCDCDKNIGVAIVSHEIYNELCYTHLNDKKNFIEIEENPLQSIELMIADKLLDLYNNKNISKKMYDKLFKFNSKLASFRVLPKLHKEKFSSRPIVNNINTPTEKLSILIDFLLQPFVKSMDSFIQDSQHLLQLLNDIRLEDNMKIYSLDFDSLYPNMDLYDVVCKITDYMRTRLNNDHIDIVAFKWILELVLFNNFLLFDKKYFKQINGLTMGIKCGPSVANIYLFILEKKFLCIYNPFIYNRFLDDIFLCVKLNFNLENLFKYFPNLKLNVNSNETVNFLDLNISICKLTNKFQFSLYTKPTNTFNYLLCNSNHPNFIFKNIPKSLFIRIRRICTNFHDYLNFSRKILFQLLSRGYNFDHLRKICHSISNLDRKSLLPYKNKTTKDFSNSIFLNLYFDKNILNSHKILNNSFSFLKNSNSSLENYKLAILSKMQPNIGSMFINKIPSLIFNFKSNNYVKCSNEKCNVCMFSDYKKKFLILNNFHLPISNRSTCSSKNIIYILICKKCNFFYIGESSRTVKERLNEHINNIKKFVPYEKRVNSVSIHFNLLNHSLTDFSFVVYDVNLEDTLRFNLEAQLIKLFLKLEMNLINDFFPSIYNNIYSIRV
jgi:hypothetical protein